MQYQSIRWSDQPSRYTFTLVTFRHLGIIHFRPVSYTITRPICHNIILSYNERMELIVWTTGKVVCLGDRGGCNGLKGCKFISMQKTLVLWYRILVLCILLCTTLWSNHTTFKWSVHWFHGKPIKLFHPLKADTLHTFYLAVTLSQRRYIIIFTPIVLSIQDSN